MKPLSASLDATNIAKLGAGIGTGALVMGYAVCKNRLQSDNVL